jgi:hypothetical protein
MMRLNRTNQGMSLLQTILLIAVIVIILSYIGFDLKGAIESDQSKKNFGYLKAATVTIWERYLERPVTYAYDEIFIPWFWEPTVNNLKKLRNGESTDIPENGPSLPLKS